jgi:hypothetical protein
VQSQVRDRNLLKSHSDTLRDSINHLFDHMKKLRSRLDEQFDKVSKDNYDKFLASLEAVEKKISDGLRLAPIFDELKEMQRNFRDSKLSREHRAKVWEKLDAAFKAVKEKRFGPETGDDKSPLDRIQRRYEGLLSAIDKMQRSIQRDQDDLEFQNRKIERTDGQLEAQIRQAKIKMIEERIRSKDEKLNEMVGTRTELEQRMEQQRRRQSERDRVEEAKKAAQEKIAQEMKIREESVDTEKLAKAVEAIKGDHQEPVVEKEQSLLDKITEKLEDFVEDSVDTVRAIAEVAGDKIEDIVDQVEDKIEDYLEKKEEEEKTDVEEIAPTPDETEAEEKTDVEEVNSTIDEAKEEKKD